MELRQRALDVLCVADPATKAAAAQGLWNAFRQGASPAATLDTAAVYESSLPLPGRPARPALVPADRVPRRSPFTLTGRAALLHAIAHIEFNAINLALDAIWRFPGMPDAYYFDWLKVAGEEAHHFTLLRDHLRSLQHDYGDFDAHDGLWSMTEKTAGDIVARMALVPRTLEARGLDATPPIQAKLAKAGDHRAVDILDIILRDEIGHVAIGNHWYAWLCKRAGLDTVSHYRTLVERFAAPRLRQPFNRPARLAAGFSEAELDYLQDTSAP